MSEAIPGWVDTGRAVECINSGTMALKANAGVLILFSLPGSMEPGEFTVEELSLLNGPADMVSLGPLTIYGWMSCGDPGQPPQALFVLDGNFPGLPRVLSFEEYAYGAGSAQGPSVTVQETSGPYRLGSKFTIQLPTDEEGNTTREPPLYGTLDGEVWYEFFWDEATQYAISGGGFSWAGPMLDVPGGTPPETLPSSLGPVVGWWGLLWSVRTPYSALVSDLVMGGQAVDLSGVDWSALEGSASVAPPVVMQLSGRVSRFGEDAPNWAHLVTAFPGDPKTVPALNGQHVAGFKYGLPLEPGFQWGWDYIGWDQKVGTHVDLEGVWAGLQVPFLPDSDYHVPVRGGLPRLGLGYSRFKAGTLRITPTLSVHRPDRRQPSSWAFEQTGFPGADVQELPTETLITVPAGDPPVARELWARWPHWVEWLAYWKEHAPEDPDLPDPRGSEQYDWVYTKPGGSTRKVAMGFREYYNAKHAASSDPFVQEDVWNWSLYSDLELELVYVPPAGKPGLQRGVPILEVEHAYLSVSDLHRDPIGVNLSASVVAGVTVQYPIRFDPGSDVARVDLLFPSRGGPFYLGYVRKLRLCGLAEGTWRIRRIDLKQTRPAYLKLAFGAPKAEPDDAYAEQLEELRESDPILYCKILRRYTPQWPTLMVSTRGTFPVNLLPDTRYKEDELGGYGGSPRYVEPAFTKSGKRLHYQKDLWGFLTDLSRIEGLEVTQDQAAYDAACKDGFGTVFGPAMADWLWPVVPWRELMPGQTIDLWASATCRAIRPTNCLAYQFVFDHALHAGFETLVSDHGNRVDPLAAPRRVWAVYSPDEPSEGAEIAIQTPTEVELQQGAAHRFVAAPGPGVASWAWEVYPAGAGTIDSQGRYSAPYRDCWAIVTLRSAQWRQLLARAYVRVGNVASGARPSPPEEAIRVVKVAYGDSDRDGFVRIWPVPANEDRAYWLVGDEELKDATRYTVLPNTDTVSQ